MIFCDALMGMAMSMKRYSHPLVRTRAKQLRHELTPAEVLLWEALRNRRLNGLKFKRQHPLGPYIADFFCTEYCLVVELDGGIHDETAEDDAIRTSQLIDHGYGVLRFQNEQVENHLPQFLEAILAACSNARLESSKF
jgi:very-short-patch-repair endonuclease